MEKSRNIKSSLFYGKDDCLSGFNKKSLEENYHERKERAIPIRQFHFHKFANILSVSTCYLTVVRKYSPDYKAEDIGWWMTIKRS